MVKAVALFTGKRKSGKDYISNRLKEALLAEKAIIAIGSVSHSLKSEYAALNGLAFQSLVSDGPYKELYRQQMIKWSEEKREKDNEYFCRQTLPKDQDKIDILIITDCRRPADIAFYKKNFKNIVLVRVNCEIKERVKRGFVFTKSIDDTASECALDDFPHDFYIDNSGDIIKLQTALDNLVSSILGFIH